MDLNKIDLKNIHKIVGEMVDGLEQVEMKGKTSDEFAQKTSGFLAPNSDVQ